MQFVLSTQEFNYLLSKMQAIVPVKPAKPILNNFLLEAKGGELIFTATDLFVGIQCRTEARVIEEGAITLPTRHLASLSREIAAMQIELVLTEDEGAQISAGESVFKVPTMKSEAFPDLPAMEGAVRCSLKQKELKNALFRTAFAVSREDSRYVLTGIAIDIAGSVATFVGTDGKKLARARLPLAVDPSFVGEYVVPIKAVEEILKNLTDDDELATLLFLHDRFAVEAGSIRLVTQLLTGGYPSVVNVIPKQANCVITLDRRDLITALRQISLFTSQDRQAVRFYFSTGVLHVDAHLADKGEGNINVACDYDGEPFQTSFNPKYMLQILEHSEGEKATLRVIDPFNPVVIVSESETEEEASPDSLDNPLFVLMPLRVD